MLVEALQLAVHDAFRLIDIELVTLIKIIIEKEHVIFCKNSYISIN